MTWRTNTIPCLWMNRTPFMSVSTDFSPNEIMICLFDDDGSFKSVASKIVTLTSSIKKRDFDQPHIAINLDSIVLVTYTNLKFGIVQTGFPS